jgi:hypothetical protein
MEGRVGDGREEWNGRKKRGERGRGRSPRLRLEESVRRKWVESVYVYRKRRMHRTEGARKNERQKHTLNAVKSCGENCEMTRRALERKPRVWRRPRQE